MKDEELFKKRFPERLFERLDVTGITQKDLAEKLEVSQPTMSHYVSGKTIPKVTTIRQMARILGCDAGWLACFHNRKKQQKDPDYEETEDDQNDSVNGWHVRPKEGWTEKSLPPKRGQDGCDPYGYQLVVEYKHSHASTEVGKRVDIKVQGIGWLNDTLENGPLGHIMYAQQLANTELAHIHDIPVAFRYSQMIAWKEIEKYVERKK